VPLPPYIRRTDGPTASDRERYQTTFAARPGAVAAPTAGLHFTPALFDALAARGVERHVRPRCTSGPGTFLPIRNDDLDGYRMAAERYVPVGAAPSMRSGGRALERRRVVASGRPSSGTLESAAARASSRRGRAARDSSSHPGHASGSSSPRDELPSARVQPLLAHGRALGGMGAASGAPYATPSASAIVSTAMAMRC
jgi:S-adenosylmethionine:tRNA ribosyltransferase-isomerase